MEQVFITDLKIENLRHLKNISIPLQENHMKHLVFTGKNGSGKTSVTEAMAVYLDNVFNNMSFKDNENWLCELRKRIDNAVKNGEDKEKITKMQEDIRQRRKAFKNGLDIKFNHKAADIFSLREEYHYILAYYGADRIFRAIEPEHVEKVQLRDNYGITEFPRSEFVKYLLDLKMTEALARSAGRIEKADKIKTWFENLEKLLQRIFADKTVHLDFDEDTFRFYILQQEKEPFGFNTLSGGYQAVLDIVLDIIMRMQKQTGRSFDFNIPGIVLIDEIETHLHLELQKNIMPLLTTIFPNIQFIVTSHSPFILNSLEDFVVYDLENNLLVKNGLDNVPYDGIVEGYFGAGKLSNVLEEKFKRYKNLVKKESLSDDDISEIAELELYLDEIPDYLALGITTEYQRFKLEFINREDIDG